MNTAEKLAELADRLISAPDNAEIAAVADELRALLAESDDSARWSLVRTRPANERDSAAARAVGRVVVVDVKAGATYARCMAWAGLLDSDPGLPPGYYKSHIVLLDDARKLAADYAAELESAS